MTAPALPGGPWLDRERCTLEVFIVLGILREGLEVPCDRCNQDRKECGGLPRRPAEWKP